ncbi:MFS family permease [Pullulanibacillus pueri]|uniref:Permease n=1 Tax=Pullulanibacillus pueri TaxID=1437324 RepID=A0A8J2ZTS4_9BACL|nr:MFS transporter [Pullulanibacillus pueri]MBM7681146.1 MFS family permease [Pullulanibacillus pueri]GGH77225.1 permease [Pullulanibacillus pueri]
MDKRSFHYLWIGQSFANFGDVMYTVSVIQLIYMFTHSAFYMSLIPFLITGSMFCSGMMTPLLIDRFSLKFLLAYSQTCKTLLILCMGFGSQLGVFFIFSVVAFIGLLDGCAIPCRNALIPHYVPEHRLVKANSLLATLDQFIRLGGWPLGSLLVTQWSSPLESLWVICFLYVLASIGMFLLQSVKVEKAEHVKKMAQSLSEGWTMVWHTPFLRTIALMDILENIAAVVWIAAIIYIYVEDVLGVSQQWWGYINGLFFGGLMLGGLFCLKNEKLIEKHLSLFLMIGIFSTLFVDFVYGIISSLIIALSLSGIMGLFGQMKDISQQVVIQMKIDKNKLPKVYSVQNTLITGTFGVSTVILGYLTDLVGVRQIFLLASTLMLCVFIIFYKHRQFFTLPSEADKERDIN